MFNTKPSTCVSSLGKPRRAYPDRSSADDGACHALSAHGNRMMPYRCTHCGSWHLCPTDRHTPSYYSSVCSKQVYDSEDAAFRRARILKQERGTRLRVYECPYGEGWHLTSSH
jgi:hypothetical protein